MSKDGLMTAVALAAGLGEGQGDNMAAGPGLPQGFTVTADLVAQHFPAVAAALRAEGATAENARVAAMDKVSMPGHEALVSAHKADPAKTAGDLAQAIIAAENGKRNTQLAALDADEKKVSGLRNAPVVKGDKPEPAQGSVRSIKDAAMQFIKDQQALGRTISPADAVAHVKQEA